LANVGVNDVTECVTTRKVLNK